MNNGITLPDNASHNEADNVNNLTIRERMYLRVIYHLLQQSEPVIAAHVTRWLNVTASTVTQTLQQLVARGFINRKGSITLTATGLALAETMVQQHYILECFLSEIMGMSWHLVHHEALRLEQALSPTLEAHISALVSHATTCPHGNLIPGRNVREQGFVRLDTVQGQGNFIIRRVAEEAEEQIDLLRYLQGNLLVPGTTVYVLITSSLYGVTLRYGNREISISPDIAMVLWGEYDTLEEEEHPDQVA
ncbi:MAG: metal-dependent transcriptional regulator [Chloroflexi bacterium AL-W]|nr:metal-dependent transcriptional regulator [Chloroflexi bacterium AL-N1]NOK67480.1 metal-dependent transcriptional regulator [Chloroflexi bacterium AL-N10]NOK75028.1 metal-dependent transcriptional regulator [Chloroflexi bacterium AL-N5]NOK81815.1 metal-dependent transcriptional regulator [Chloroflexi bacterium AL-W]NOK89661.1 metal-dependent transcriptional regulator [Chloroflexi bacterium AL-N15]